MRTAAEQTELQRLRRELYRPSPPPGALERYTALLEQEPAAAVPPAEPDPVPTRRRPVRRLAITAVALAAVVAGALAVPALIPPERDPAQAEALVTGGPYAVADRDAIDALLVPADTDPRLMARAISGSELPQLDVWDTRSPAIWLQQGRGPVTRRFDGRPPAEAARPFSIVVQCDRPARYRWTIIGTTPQRPAVHVLETAGTADCGSTPTVATFTRPVGAVVRGFDLTIPAEVRWGMAFVRPADQGT